MPLGDVPALPGQVDDGLPGVRRPARRVPVLAADVVDHELDQVLLGRHVVVQRHRAHAERGRDAPHGDRVQALGVGQRHRGRRDRGPAVPGLRPPAAALRDVPDRQRRDRSRPRLLRRRHHLASPPGNPPPGALPRARALPAPSLTSGGPAAMLAKNNVHRTERSNDDYHRAGPRGQPGR